MAGLPGEQAARRQAARRQAARRQAARRPRSARPSAEGVVVAVLFGVLLGACGDGSAATTTTSVPVTTTTAGPATTTTAAPTTTVAETTTTTEPGPPAFSFGVVDPGTYSAGPFGLPFTLEVGEGWFVKVRPTETRVSLALTDSDRRTLDVPYLEFLLTQPDTPVDEVATRLDQANIDVLSTEPVSIVGFEGLRVTAFMERFGAIAVFGSPTGGDLAPANEPATMRFDILDVGGTTLIIWAEALPDEFDEFIAEFADPVLATLEFR
jgi:hypothetical protein